MNSGMTNNDIHLYLLCSKKLPCFFLKGTLHFVTGIMFDPTLTVESCHSQEMHKASFLLPIYAPTLYFSFASSFLSISNLFSILLTILIKSNKLALSKQNTDILLTICVLPSPQCHFVCKYLEVWIFYSSFLPAIDKRQLVPPVCHQFSHFIPTPFWNILLKVIF